MNSILDTTKRVLGIPIEDTAFDTEITLHLNSVFSDLQQLGVGPADGFEIVDKEATWDQFLGTDKGLNNVKTYVFLRLKLLFDLPPTSFAIEAVQKQIEELEWRINIHREEARTP